MQEMVSFLKKSVRVAVWIRDEIIESIKPKQQIHGWVLKPLNFYQNLYYENIGH